MMIRAFFAFTLALAACSPAQSPAPEQTPVAPPAEASAPSPITLKELEAAHEWQRMPGEQLNAAWVAGAKAILGKLSRPAAMDAVSEAGFSCIYGEAHQDYPDPMAVCTRSFATRACQMDWEISSTADKGMVDRVDGAFRRDCVELDDDWPDKVKSAIDDQQAPQAPPQ
ncbi:MAG: hypothetical protein ABL956_10900 [Hyphomonadaceae bacterium]